MIPFRVAVVVPVLTLFTCPAFAQPQLGDPQPDRLHLGVVYVRATVEASFLLRETGDNPNIKLDVRAPRFVKVLHKSTEVRHFGPMDKDVVFGNVEIAIDTTKAGKFRGELIATLGKTTAKVPVSVTVKERPRGLIPILIADTPFEMWTTKDGTMFKAWTDLVENSSLDVNYLLVHRGKHVLRDLKLRKFTCVFLPAEALVFATPEDIQRVREYAEKGGWVVVGANHFFQGSVEKANAVLAGYGLQMQDEEARMGQNDVLLGKDALDPELVKVGVESLRFFRASPITVTDAKKARVLARAAGAGRAGDGFVVRARAGKGNVMAIGESLWWRWISQEQARGADNAKLLRWLLTPS